MGHNHFGEKDALGHVAEAQAKGIISATEIHGEETPSHITAVADAAREMAIVILLLDTLLGLFPLGFWTEALLLAIFALGWGIWKIGRCTWLGWFRLERLHRVLQQEKWEIEHNRPQEREELKVLYQAKGFEGKLLEDVVDVLMADGDRLLRVMVEEEMGLTLENHEHPIKQGVGALLGSALAFLIGLLGLYVYPEFGVLIAGVIVIAICTGFLAYYARNEMIPAIVWNGGLAILAFGAVYFVSATLFPEGIVP